MSNELIFNAGDTGFDSLKIKYNDYMRSLLTVAEGEGMVNQAEIAFVQARLMKSLGDLINFFTDGKSSSVMLENANKLLQCLLFNIDFYLISLNSHREALNTVLSDVDFTELYYEGQKKMKRYVYECTSLVVKAKSTSLPIQNIYYNQTLENELLSSLKLYDMRFGSHLCPSFSYPLGCDIKNLRGIHYLRGYLMNLCTENEFLSHYDVNQLRRFGGLFSEKRGFPIHDVRINIYSLVLINEIINGYLRKEDNTLIVTEDECDITEQLMSDLSGDEIANLLLNVAQEIPFGNPDYNRKCARRIMPEMVNAIVNCRLKNYAVSQL